MSAATPTLASADVLLADGAVALLRELRADDADSVHALHERVSDDALRMRFFAVSRSAAHQYVERVLRDEGTLALVVEASGAPWWGWGTAEPLDESTCEVAFLVADESRGKVSARCCWSTSRP